MSESKKRSPLALKIILPFLILIIGVVGFKMMGKLKKAPHRERLPQLGRLVEVMPLVAETHRITVHATGTVQAAQQISLVPEVSGKVRWISPRLVSGGVFEQGEILLKIDPTDFALAREKSRAEIAGAHVALAIEQERAKLAIAEWQRIDLVDKGEPGALVTHELQLRQQQANLAAATANLKYAELQLQRTELKAPFNGRIRQEQVDYGQYLRAGVTIGTFAGTDRAEVQIPLPTTELEWLILPGNGDGSRITIHLPGRTDARWTGKLTRTSGEIDPQTRMATIVVEVEDPYQLNSAANQPPLPNGQFVEVELTGRELKDVFVIPRKSLHSGNLVWLVSSDNRLQLQPVEVLRREKQHVVIKGDIETGQQLILTSISGAAAGTLLRPVVQEKQR